MADEKLLTVRDVSMLLNISEKEVLNLAETRAIPAYKIGGMYLRFKKEQVLQYKKTFHHTLPKAHNHKDYSLTDKISDFFYFNDFYVLSAILIILLVVVIFQGL
ncbi:MAG: helix-turn-helix domain-containing protein [Candidatus Omnitrophica bacterium]|nr:helix-turn-helix domain-containing protein [Candidatus Omnitrophota bacterium]